MKNTVFTAIFLLLSLSCSNLLGQCSHIALADSSFEEGTLTYGGTFDPGSWYIDDGCMISTAAPYDGDSCVCSNGGGAFQYVRVDSNTTYYLSCYVRNGKSDSALHFRINGSVNHFFTASNNWTFASQSFNSGSDTTATIGFYSFGACFDQVRLTCDPLAANQQAEPKRSFFSIFPTVSAQDFTIGSEQSLKLKIIDLSGRTHEKMEVHGTTATFGESLPTGIYLIEFRSEEKLAFKKIVKL